VIPHVPREPLQSLELGTARHKQSEIGAVREKEV